MSNEQTIDPHAYTIDNLPPFMDHWKAAVEGGSSPEQIAENSYDENAELKGTIADEFVQGYENIRDYFVKFTDGKNEARIEFESIKFDEERGLFFGDYTFHWKDNDGVEQSLPATYRFTPTDLKAEDAKIAVHYSHPRAEL